MRTTIGPREFRDIYWLQGGLSPDEARELVGVDRRTWRRWAAGEARIPWSAVRLLQVVAAGELPPSAGDPWAGFRFVRGLLYTPNGDEVAARDVLALAFQRVNGMLYCLGHGECRNAERRRAPVREIRPRPELVEEPARDRRTA